MGLETGLSVVEEVKEPALHGDEPCDACRLPQPNCICQFRPILNSPVKFCLLTHNDEIRKPTNTGRLVADSLSNTEVYRWHRTQPDPALLNLIANPAYQTWLVFPADDPEQSTRVSDFAPIEGREPLFLILDGTWQQAAKMFRRSPYLNHLPILSIDLKKPTQYRLRRASKDHHLCTVEIATALMRVAGDEENATILDDYFHAFSQHYLAARSNHKVKTQSPEMVRLLTFNTPASCR